MLRVQRLRPAQVVRFVIGPSLITLGISIGSRLGHHGLRAAADLLQRRDLPLRRGHRRSCRDRCGGTRFAGLVTPAAPPEGITATLLLNFLFFGFFFVNFVYELFTGGALVEF
ncbi:hypothetical protein [Amycolatopsis thermoflava]|uniref:hypothetical protein n=1 Tax=Amycolatopsis thermoflava TaxID=84480 RepID=UPI003F4A79F0